MTHKRLWTAGLAVALAASLGVATRLGFASDHDDGETDLKSRALNLTDHYAFKDGDNLALVMYVNPRSLPGRQYQLSTAARYEFHVSKADSKVAAPTAKDDYTFRFEAQPPDSAGSQPIKLTILRDGAVVGTHSGTTTPFASSKANTPVTNMGTVETFPVKYFIGQRADTFTFDVNRFFQVRSFLAQRFFGGAGGTGDPTAALAANCRGDTLFTEAAAADADHINLWNPPSCAPDFTKNLNVTAIVLDVPIAALGGGAVFDTWSSISVAQ